MAMKACPACGNKHGPRTKACDCGHKFVTNIASVPASGSMMTVVKPVEPRAVAKSDEADEPLKRRPGAYNVVVPAGPCPVKPKGYRADSKDHWPDGPASDDDVTEWSDAVVRAGSDRGVYYTPEALVYWSRSFWTTEEEYQRVKGLLRKSGN